MRFFTINVILAFVSITKSQINFNGPSNNRRGGASASVNVEARAISNSRGRVSASVSGAFSTQSGSNKNNFNFNSKQTFISNKKPNNILSRFGNNNNNNGCSPASQCSAQLFTYNEYSKAQCTLRNGSPGFRCSSRNIVGSSRRPFGGADAEASASVGIRTVSTSGGGNDINVALRSSRNKVSNITNFSSRQYSSPLPGSAAFYHAKFQRQARSDVSKVGKFGLLTSETALVLSKVSVRRGGAGSGSTNDAVNFGSSSETSQNLESAGLSCSSSSLRCGRSSAYRTADGSCNNLREPRYGMADTSLNRIALPEYSNGVDTMRQSFIGGSLPSARLLSTKLATDLRNQDQKHTYITMTFGQFVDHDLTHSPIMKTNTNQDIDCCRSGAPNDAFCAPIDIPSGDPIFRGRSNCMNLVRSVPSPGKY